MRHKVLYSIASNQDFVRLDGRKRRPPERLVHDCSMLLFAIEDAHRAELVPQKLTHLQEELLIVLRLVIRVGPREKLVGVVSEMHRDFPEDALAQVDSVVEIFR